MLNLASAFALSDRPAAVLFRDADDPGVVHVLTADLAVDQAGGRAGAQITVMGRGPRSREDSILGAFWTLSMIGNLGDDDRRAIAHALTPESGVPPRLVSVDADLVLKVTLCDAPPVQAKANVTGWRGGVVALSGDASGPAAVALTRAWSDGLPDAHLEAAFTLRGLAAEQTVTADQSSLSVHLMAPSAARIALSTLTFRQRDARAGSATLIRDAPLRFSREKLRRATITAGFSD